MEIEEWLKNPLNYNVGVDIYKKTKGHNKLLLRQFLLRENNLRKEKLVYELKKLYALNYNEPLVTDIAPTIPIKNIKENRVLNSAEISSKKSAPLFYELPSELRPVLLEANNLFKENCFLKAELNEVAIGNEVLALQIQTKIDRNFKANAMCWDKIEYWREHKILPKITSVQTISSYSMDKLIKKQQLLNSSVCRMEKRLAENKALLTIEENSELRTKIARKISKQEGDIIKKREELLIIKTTIDVKSTSI